MGVFCCTQNQKRVTIVQEVKNMSRIDRVNSEIQKIVSKVIAEEIKDPSVAGKIVSVVGVRTSSDLSHAKVFISVLADDTAQLEVFSHIKRAEKFIQKRVGEELDIRKVPELNLVYDESIEQGRKVLDILEQLKKDNNQ